MSTRTRIECDNCKKIIAFELLQREIKEKELTEFYFICDKCEVEYHAFYENAESLALQKQINAESEKVMSTTTPKERVETFKSIKKLREEKRKIMAKINETLKNRDNQNHNQSFTLEE